MKDENILMYITFKSYTEFEHITERLSYHKCTHYKKNYNYPISCRKFIEPFIEEVYNNGAFVVYKDHCRIHRYIQNSPDFNKKEVYTFEEFMMLDLEEVFKDEN